jgi:ParB family chromosome partitioning protein
MDYASNPIEITWIPVSSIAPNPWNPNRMSKDKLTKLRSEINARGFIAPVLVRPFGESLQIVDGEHRWRIAKEQGLEKIPCVVSQLDDSAAMIKTLQMNGFRGENDPEKLASLLADLARDTDRETLSRLLPWSEFEIEQLISMEEMEKAQSSLRDMITVKLKPPELELYVVVVTSEQRLEIEQAVEEAKKRLAVEDDGKALSSICRDYRIK